MTDAVMQGVRTFWEAESCGERTARTASRAELLARQAAEKYRVEPYIVPFARFEEAAGLDVLEIGVGMGADHERWAHAGPRRLCGVDLTQRAIAFTQERLAVSGLSSELRVANAEALPFEDASFDLVWSWGCLHHTPDTARAIAEIRRVLRPGGTARVMLYHRHGLVFLLYWVRHALLTLRPWRSLADVIAEHVESDGTHAYTPAEAVALFAAFQQVECRTVLTMGDVLEGPIGRRHGGPLLRVLCRCWPRWLVRAIGPRLGSDLLIEVTA